MDDIGRLVDVIVLASAASGCAAVLAASARSPHPRLRNLAFLLGVYALKAGLFLASGRGPVPPPIAFVSSLIDFAVFPYAFARLSCLAGSGEWRGPRAAAYAAYAAAFAALLCMAQALAFCEGFLPPSRIAALRGLFEIAFAFVLRPAFAVGIGFAIVDLVMHVMDCPWPGVRKLLRISWPLFLGMSLLSLVGAFLGGAGFAFKGIIVLGSALSLGESLAHLRREGRRANPSGAAGPAAPRESDREPEAESMDRLGFTGREREAIRLILDGWTYADVARFLSISPTTVKTHVQSCYRKAGAANKLELLRILRRGLPS